MVTRASTNVNISRSITHCIANRIDSRTKGKVYRLPRQNNQRGADGFRQILTPGLGTPYSRKDRAYPIPYLARYHCHHSPTSPGHMLRSKAPAPSGQRGLALHRAPLKLDRLRDLFSAGSQQMALP